jgi:hypothetical protein
MHNIIVYLFIYLSFLNNIKFANAKQEKIKNKKNKK